MDDFPWQRPNWQSDWESLARGEAPCLQLGTPPADPAVVLSGSFNPLHHGHLQLARVAQRLLQRQVTFEISIENVDKPLIDSRELQRRLRQFDPQQSVVATCAARFVDKAGLFERPTFVMGVDTLQRIVDPRYGHSRQEHAEDLRRLCELTSQLLVFGRQQEGRFVCASDVEMPAQLARICRGVPESEFRHDLSSTELRSR